MQKIQLVFGALTCAYRHTLLFIYEPLAQWSIFTFIPSILIITFSPENYVKLAFPLLGIMFLYTGWMIKRTGKLKGMDFIARILVFYTLFTIQYLALTLLIPILLILTGYMDIQDLLPKSS